MRNELSTVNTIHEDKVDLTLVLQAVQTKDEEKLQGFIDQGYQLAWKDHATHKTLPEILGERFDLEAIDWLRSKEMCKKVWLNEKAIEGAAFANKSLTQIEQIADLKYYYPFAYYGAAKGGHEKLIDDIRAKLRGDGRDPDLNNHFIVSGATEANHHAIPLYKYATSRDYNQGRMVGAARGGDEEVVLQMLKNHTLYRDESIRDQSGYSIAYKVAIENAAANGHARLIAKVFSYQDQRQYTMENPKRLIGEGLWAAAYNGHDNLVFDLIGRLKLYCNNQLAGEDFRDAVNQAFHGAIEGGRYKLVRKLFKTLDNPKLCYQIAYLCEDDENSQRKDLIPLVNEIYGFTITRLALLSCSDPSVATFLGIYHRLVVPLTQDLAFHVAKFAVSDPKVDRQHMQMFVNFRKQVGEYKPVSKQEVPDPKIEAVNAIKTKLLAQIDLYLKSMFNFHSERAKALYTSIEALTTIDSIQILIEQQIELMNAFPSKSTVDKPQPPLERLARQSSRTGYALFKVSTDYLSTLDSCMAIINQYNNESFDECRKLPESLRR